MIESRYDDSRPDQVVEIKSHGYILQDMYDGHLFEVSFEEVFQKQYIALPKSLVTYPKKSILQNFINYFF